MHIDMTDLNTPAGFYAVTFETFAETLEESEVTFSIDMGGVTIHGGTRFGESIWLLDNPTGLYGIWVEANDARPQ